MKTNMTERDKRLIFLLLIGVIIVAIGYWGILPQVKEFRDLETKVEQEQEEKTINQLKISNAGVIEIQADEYDQKIAEKKDEFYQTMNSSEVDRMMTHLAVDRNLEVYDLKFNMPQSPSARAAYQYSELYQTQKALKAEYDKSEDDDDEEDYSVEKELDDEDEDSSDDKGSSSSGSEKSDSKSKSNSKKETKQKIMDEVMGEEEGGYQPNTDIYAVPVTMTVGGEIDDLNAFIKDIIGIEKRVLLVGYSWGEFREVVKRDAEGNIISTAEAKTTDSEGVSTDELTDMTVEIVTKKSLTVKLEIFMCDTEDIASETDASSAE